jgi:predicted nucleic acid-binding protein
MKYLIDSDIAVDHLSGKPWATDLITSLLDSGVAMSLMAYAELYEGVLYGRRSAFGDRVLRVAAMGHTSPRRAWPMCAVRRGRSRRGGRSRLCLGADLLEGEEGRLHRARRA